MEIFQSVWLDCVHELHSLRDIDRLQAWLVRIDVAQRVQFLETIQPNRLEDLHRIVALQSPFERNRVDHPGIPMNKELPGLAIAVQTFLDQLRIGSITHSRYTVLHQGNGP